jgi:hypothetical protein
MKIFLAFFINLVISLGTSYILYKFFKKDVSPTIISIALIVVYMFLPQKFHDWIAEK